MSQDNQYDFIVAVNDESGETLADLFADFATKETEYIKYFSLFAGIAQISLQVIASALILYLLVKRYFKWKVTHRQRMLQTF